MDNLAIIIAFAELLITIYFYRKVKQAYHEIAYLEQEITDRDEIMNSDDDAERVSRYESMLGTILDNTEFLMVDTTKLLEAAHRATTDSASLRELIKSVKASLDKSLADLRSAIAASDPVATAAAQKDVDDATALLNTDSVETEAALAANIEPAPTPAPTPEPVVEPAPVAEPVAEEPVVETTPEAPAA